MIRRITVSLTASLIILALLLSGCSQSSSTPTAQPSGAATAANTAPKVDVAKVEKGNLSSNLEYNGNIQARQTVNIVPKASGRVVKMAVDVGSIVKAGDVLVEIEKETLSAQVAQAQAGVASAAARLNNLQAGPRAEQVAQAEANVKSAEARLAQLKAGPTQAQIEAAEAQVRLAQNQLYQTQVNADAQGRIGFTQTQKEAAASVSYENIKIAEANLANLKAGATPETITQQEAAVDAARQALALAKQPTTEYDIQAAQAAVSQAQAAYDLTKLQLNEATIKAPFDGVISARAATEGTMVGPTASVLTLISASTEVAINVDDRALATIKQGQPATITVTTYGDQKFPATVTSVSPTVDSRTRTSQVKLAPTDPEGKLRDGMFAKVVMQLNTGQTSTLLVPKNAVTTDQGATIVYVAADGKVKRQVVTTGSTDGTKIEITDGLSEGQTIVVSDLTTLRDGAQVEVK
jgi:HlyD family secretion protein